MVVILPNIYYNRLVYYPKRIEKVFFSFIFFKYYYWVSNICGMFYVPNKLVWNDIYQQKKKEIKSIWVPKLFRFKRMDQMVFRKIKPKKNLNKKKERRSYEWKCVSAEFAWFACYYYCCLIKRPECYQHNPILLLCYFMCLVLFSVKSIWYFRHKNWICA